MAASDIARRAHPTLTTTRRSYSAALALQVLAALVWCAAGRAQSVEEMRVKAAFVSKFPEFTEWPSPVLDNRTTLELCVVQSGLFHTELASLVHGASVHGRLLVTRTVDASAIDGCHVLFLPALTPASRRHILARAAELPVLTVSDAAGFLDDGGIVQLRVAEGRVRFDVNLTAAHRARLRLHSQLLRLARQVREGPS